MISRWLLVVIIVIIVNCELSRLSENNDPSSGSVGGGGQIPSNQLPTISIFITQNHRKEYCSVSVLTGPKILVLPSLSPLNFRLG